MSNKIGFLFFSVGLVGALAFGWLGLPYLLYERIEQPIQFSHAFHVGDDVGMSCEDCHGFDDFGRFTGVPGIDNCAECHEEQLGETESERLLVEEYINEDREIPWLIYSRQPDNAHFPHSQHVVLAELPCARCHGPHGETDQLRPFERNKLSGYSRDIWGPNISGLGTKEWEGMKMSDCCDCHKEKGVVESCLDCHK
jgi:menaquinone reductase, multiheme cytochrome c subunit